MVSDSEKRRWVRRPVDFTVRVLFPSRGIREVCEAYLQMKDLSEGGAALVAGQLHIPTYFYIQFGQDEEALTTCFMVARNDGVIHCRFVKEFSAAEIERIVTEQEALTALSSLGGLDIVA